MKNRSCRIAIFILFATVCIPQSLLSQNGTFEKALNQTDNDILIIDLTDDYFTINQKSADSIKVSLQNLGNVVSVQTTLDSSIPVATCDAVFCCLGMFPYNGVLSEEQIQILGHYLSEGGRLYLEGGDPWYYDPIYYNRPKLQTWFGIDANWDGRYLGDLDQVNGIAGTVWAGYDFIYQTFMNYSDFLSLDWQNAPNALGIWESEIATQDGSDSYTILAGIANDGEGYRTIGTSFEFMGIPAADKQGVMAAYLNFLLSGLSKRTALPGVAKQQINSESTPSERIATHRSPKLFNQFVDEIPTETLMDSLAFWDFLVLNTWNLFDEPEALGPQGRFRQTNPNNLVFIYFSPDIILSQTIKVNAGLLTLLQDQWFIKDINGAPFKFFNLGDEWTQLLNLSTEINDLLPYYLNKHILNTGLADGIYYDWVSETIAWANDLEDNPSGPIDIDNDGVADSDSKIDQTWIDGMKELLGNSLKYYPESCPLIGNGGWKFDDTYKNLINGRMIEDFTGAMNCWGWHPTVRCHHMMDKGTIEPKLPMIHKTGLQTDYQAMRFGLSTSLLFNIYYCYTSEIHYRASWWYDEYAVDTESGNAVYNLYKKGYLGEPLNDAHNALNRQVKLGGLLDSDDASSANILWRRDYENGVVFCNPSSSPVLLTLAQIKGTRNTDNIYRINGTQDPTINSGAQVTSGITIPAKDGIILLVDCVGTAVRDDKGSSLPTQFSLAQNYPNPFNPVTIIQYSLPYKTDVKIKVYNINGKEIETVFNGNRPAGEHKLPWDASNYSAGIYLIQMKSHNFIDTQKCMLVK